MHRDPSQLVTEHSSTDPVSPFLQGQLFGEIETEEESQWALPRAGGQPVGPFQRPLELAQAEKTESNGPGPVQLGAEESDEWSSRVGAKVAPEPWHEDSFPGFGAEGEIQVLRERHRVVLVGERIVLDLKKILSEKLGFEVVDVSWTVPGTRVRQYLGDRHQSQLTGVTSKELEKSKLIFHWVAAADGMEVRARVTWRLWRAYGSSEIIFPFDVKGPTLDHFRATTDRTRLEGGGIRFGSIGKIRNGKYVRGSEGIVWDWQVTMPPRHGGWIKDLQTVRMSRKKVQLLKRGGRATRKLVYKHPKKALHEQLDQAFADEGREATYSASGYYPPIAFPTEVKAGKTFRDDATWDSPFIGLAPLDVEATVDEYFKYYVLFKPDQRDAIWVPIAKAEWFWKAKAVKRHSRWRLVQKEGGVSVKGSPSSEFPLYESNANANEWLVEEASAEDHEFDESGHYEALEERSDIEEGDEFDDEYDEELEQGPTDAEFHFEWFTDRLEPSGEEEGSAESEYSQELVESFQDKEIDERLEFQYDISPSVADALQERDWSGALRLVIEEGQRDDSGLTNLIFFARHPELEAGKLNRKQPKFKQLSREWIVIRRREVWPAIQKFSENTLLAVDGKDAAAGHRQFWGRSGKRFKELIKQAAGSVDLNPGLLAATLLAEIGTKGVYLRKHKVSSYRIGVDDFYERRNAIAQRVPAYSKINWDRKQKPVEHYNDATKPRLVKTIRFDSGPDALLASAVYLKYGEERLREEAENLGEDFDNLPLETRWALIRMAFNAGVGGATRRLTKALNGKDILIRKNLPRRAYRTDRNATIHTARALHLSEWIFGVPMTPEIQPQVDSTSRFNPKEEINEHEFEDEFHDESYNREIEEGFDEERMEEVAEEGDAEPLPGDVAAALEDIVAGEVQGLGVEAFEEAYERPPGGDPEGNTLTGGTVEERIGFEQENARTRCGSYNGCLDEALRALRPSFGPPVGPTERFDNDYWEAKADPTFSKRLRAPYGRMLVLKPNKDPSKALKAAVDKSSSKWSLDCAYFVQVANLYALSQLNPASFDRKWKNQGFRLRYHWSDGLRTKYYFRRESRTAPWRAKYGGKWHTVSSKWNAVTILGRAMPKGSRVMWTNELAPRGDPFRNENTVKVGNDRYRAFGFGTNRVLTGRQIVLLLAAAHLNEPKQPIIEDPTNAASSVRTFASNHVFLKEATSFHRP